MTRPLPDGFHDVSRGKLAVVVTYFEMTAPPVRPAAALPDGVTIARVLRPEIGWYRALFRRVGTDWLWFDRLRFGDDALAAVLSRPSLTVLTMTRDGEDIGFAELETQAGGSVEIVYFGLVGEATGGGLGRALMDAALKAAWEPGVRRVWLHTCTLDHPRAISFYVRSGFTPYDNKVEVTDDPRLTGLLPPNAAPHVPMLGAMVEL